MEESFVYRLSVREFVEYSLKSGDICAAVAGTARMLEGTLGHQALQSQQGEGYSAEVPVSYTFQGEIAALEISGRIDGILTENASFLLHGSFNNL